MKEVIPVYEAPKRINPYRAASVVLTIVLLTGCTVLAVLSFLGMQAAAPDTDTFGWWVTGLVVFGVVSAVGWISLLASLYTTINNAAHAWDKNNKGQS